jgi:hypothetical protein
MLSKTLRRLKALYPMRFLAYSQMQKFLPLRKHIVSFLEKSIPTKTQTTQLQ